MLRCQGRREKTACKRRREHLASRSVAPFRRIGIHGEPCSHALDVAMQCVPKFSKYRSDFIIVRRKELFAQTSNSIFHSTQWRPRFQTKGRAPHRDYGAGKSLGEYWEIPIRECPTGFSRYFSTMGLATLNSILRFSFRRGLVSVTGPSLLALISSTWPSPTYPIGPAESWPTANSFFPWS